MTKEALEKATGQELIEQDAIMRDYCGVDGYYGDYLDNVNAEMLKRFNRLTELEKRCANYEMTISKMEKDLADYQFNYPTIKELQKENAELKKQLEMSNKVYNDNLDYSHHIEEQLTKAKDLLAKWVELFKPKLEGYPITPIQEQTEQFLKDCEVEK